jgi:hypothetical protein
MCNTTNTVYKCTASTFYFESMTPRLAPSAQGHAAGCLDRYTNMAGQAILMST